MRPTTRALFASALVAALLAGCSSSKAASTATTTAPAGGATTTTRAGAPTKASGTAKASGASVPSAGCHTPAPAGPGLTAERQTMTVDGTERWYLLTTPAVAAPGMGASSARRPLPLVFDLHGLAEGAQVQSMMSGFPALARKDRFVVLEPNGTGSPVRWDADPKSQPNHDLNFITKLLDDTEAHQCIDLSRVYATGLSYGAFMTSALACTMTNRFAAVAPVSGVQKPDGCKPSRAIPMLVFHGTADPILKFNGGVGGDVLMHALGGGPAPAPTTTVPAQLSGPGYPATVAAWAKQNGCDARPTDTPVGQEVIRRVYHCPAGADVEFVIVKGGGHSWPGSTFSASIDHLTGHTTFDINATNATWAFFQRFQLP